MANLPLILLANDDGYASDGIRAMRSALATFAQVVTLAPENEQSASSHALTLHRPLRLRTIEPDVYAIDGTPADCIYAALYSGLRIVPRPPDLVVAGLNRGLNLGQDAFYSGTIAAAREGALRGIPAIAASADVDTDVERATVFCARVAGELLTTAPRSSTLLNINVPKNWTGAVRATRLGERIYDEFVEFRRDPRGREYFWLGGPGVRHNHDPGSDTDAYEEGAASITPLLLDLTHHGQDKLSATIAAKVSA